MHQPCLCSLQQGCRDCCQLQLPEDYPGLSFCQPELVGEVAELVGEVVGELADWKDVFPPVFPMHVPAWLGQLLFAPDLEEWQAFSAMKDFEIADQREALVESQTGPEFDQIAAEQMSLELIVAQVRGCSERVLHCLQTNPVLSLPEQTTLGQQPVTHCFSSPHFPCWVCW